MRLLRDVVVCLLIVAIVAAILFPVFAQSKDNHRDSCLSNVKQMATGLLMYVDDFDDRLPNRDRWMDAEYAYTKNEGLYHCPLAKTPYGYALNSLLDGAKVGRFHDPQAIPAIYDSVNPIRSASDPVASLPVPGRHRGLNSIAYLDGHARRVR